MTSEKAPGPAYKDLCIDAVDPGVAAEFYAAALGLRIQELDDGDYRLNGETPEQLIWVNRVPEPKTVKHRVHLDVHVAQVADLVAVGASLLDVLPGWTLLADPEGGEICAFVREPDRLPTYRFYELVVDAVDHLAIATWWADRLGGQVEHEDDDDFSAVVGGAGLPFELVFQEVPEPQTVKNRVHWDVWGSTPDLVAAGATLVRARDQEIGWDVLADPEGNEFCCFAPPAADRAESH